MNKYRYDTVIKEMFQSGAPRLLQAWTDGVGVKECLSVELPAVQARYADLVLLLNDKRILHIEFQTANHAGMAYRMAGYGVLIGERYRRKVRQVVLYLGQARMRMADHIDLGEIQARYTLVDIRSFDAEELLASGGAADCALALLAAGGVDRMREIIEAANRLGAGEREKALTRMAVLAGLRGKSNRFTMELKSMGIYIDIEENVFLKEIRDNALAAGREEGLEQGREQGREQGLEQGREQGREEGMARILGAQIQARFGKLPAWAGQRLGRASAAQLERWGRKLLDAKTLEEVIGKRHA